MEEWLRQTIYHKQITDARASGNHGDQTARSQKRQINAIKRNNKKLKSLESKISAAKVQLEKSKSNKVSSADDKNDKDYNASNSFGGKNSKKHWLIVQAWDEIGMMMGNNFMCLLLLMSLVCVRVRLACVMDVVDGDFLSDRRKMIVRVSVCSVRTSS